MDNRIPATAAGISDAPAATVRFLLDDTPHEVPSGTSLADLVTQLGHTETSVATAVNGRFVARGLRAGYSLRSGDTVLLFQAIVGG